jgi:signal transduction histidine kinase
MSATDDLRAAARRLRPGGPASAEIAGRLEALADEFDQPGPFAYDPDTGVIVRLIHGEGGDRFFVFPAEPEEG